VTSVSVAGVDLSVANDMKALCVVIDIPETRHGGSTIVQLWPSAIHAIYCLYRTLGYTGLQSHTDQTGLLQLSAVRCSSQQHSDSAASAKQCIQDRSPSSKTILMPSHYCVSCIGCPFNTESSTKWLCWPSVAAAPQHRHTSVVISRLSSVNGHFARLPSHYWTSRSSGQTSRDELLVVLRQLSGTRCLRQSALTHSLSLNLGLRRTSFIRLLSKTCRQRLWSQGLRRFINRSLERRARGISFTVCVLLVRFLLSTISRQPTGRFKPHFACGRTLVPDLSSPLVG